jgi:cell shape-determining protein MreD
VRTPFPLWVLVVCAALAVVLEARFPASLRVAGAGPDLLLPLCLISAARLRSRLAGAALLGLLRDAVAGGPAGLFTLGYLLAGVLARSLLARTGVPGLLVLAVVLVPAALVAHAPALVHAVLLDGAAPEHAGRLLAGQVLWSVLLAPAIAVPAMALRTLGGRVRPAGVGA